MAETTAVLTIAIEGTDGARAAIDRCHDDLQAACDRLVAMGWTQSMAEIFVREIAESVVCNMIRIEPGGPDAKC